jgi:hypothetical protein
VLKNVKPHNPEVVDLTESIMLRTAIARENHAALRSGFAGYPPNPRWNVTKFRAWKTGRQLKEALEHGEMVVRSTDCMLVPAQDQGNSTDEEVRSSQWIDFFSHKKLVLAA